MREEWIGTFAGRVNEAGDGIAPLAGPAPVIVGDKTRKRGLPPPGTEVSYVVLAIEWPQGRRLYATRIRTASGGRP